MKTKQEILEWLDRQSWKSEFYEEAFIFGNEKSYDSSFITNAFDWGFTSQGRDVWRKRNSEFMQWYDSENRPLSWEEYCEQHPITKDDWCIEYGEVCEAWDPILSTTPQERDPKTCAGIMSKEYCEAFVAYMKLIQLRNAWVKDENLDELPATFKILYQDNKLSAFRVNSSTGLSFSDALDAADFFNTFIDLLEVAKPLL